MLFHVVERVFLQTAHLSLGDADLPGDLHLRAPLKEAQRQDVLFPLAEAAEGLAHADHIQPVVVRALVVGHLIHDVEGVAAVVIDGLKEADRVLNRLQGKDHVLAGQLELLGKLGYIGLAAHALGQTVARLERLVGDVAQAAADADGVVVAQVAADLADNHGHGIGGKAHVLRHVEVVQRLDEADAAHLEQVVHVFPAVAEALDHAEHQAQIAPDEFLARVQIAAVHQGKELAHALV